MTNHVEYLKELGANIKRLRLKKGMTQTQLGLNCDFERGNMRRIEAGRTSPTLKTLIKIADALEIEPYQLLKIKRTIK